MIITIICDRFFKHDDIVTRNQYRYIIMSYTLVSFSQIERV